MFRLREETIYAVVLLPLIILEGCLAIPMFVPLFDTKMSELYLVAGIAHTIGILFLITKMVDVRPYLFHGLGILGLFISVIPYINSLFHLVVCILGIRAIKRCVKYVAERNQENKHPVEDL